MLKFSIAYINRKESTEPEANLSLRYNTELDYRTPMPGGLYIPTYQSYIYLFSLSVQPSAGYGLFVHEVSSHTTTRHSR
jgi:hypothetical protein